WSRWSDAMSARSKCDAGSDTDHDGIADRTRAGGIRRVRRVTAGVDNELQVRLHRPPGRPLCAGGPLDCHLIIADGMVRAAEEIHIAVEAARGVADARVGDTEAEHVVAALRQ